MEWLCSCGKPVTTMEVMWVWRDAASIGHKHGRYVSYRCRIGCGDCVQNRGERDLQYFQLKLTARTKQNLVGQVLAEIMGSNPEGYVPRTDIQSALRHVTRGSRKVA